MKSETLQAPNVPHVLHPRTTTLELAVAELERTGARLRIRRPGVRPTFTVTPRGVTTDTLRHGLDEHRVTVARLLMLWGDDAGSLLLRILWHPAPLPSAPFSIGPGRTVTDAAAWLARLRTDALDGPTGARARMGALQADLAALACLPS